MANPTQSKAQSDKKPSAALTCLGSPELLESIMGFLDVHEITRLSAVCTEFAQQIEENPRLQRWLLYRSGNASTVWEVDLAAETISIVKAGLATSRSASAFCVVPARLNELFMRRSIREDGPSDVPYLHFKLLADLIPSEIQLFDQLKASRSTKWQTTGGIVSYSIGAGTWKSNTFPTNIEASHNIRRTYITDPLTHRVIMRLCFFYRKCPAMQAWQEYGPDLLPIDFPARVNHRGRTPLVDDDQYHLHEESEACCRTDETIIVVDQQGPVRLEDVIWHLEQNTHSEDRTYASSFKLQVVPFVVPFARVFPTEDEVDMVESAPGGVLNCAWTPNVIGPDEVGLDDS